MAKIAKIDEGACSLFYGFSIKDKNGKLRRNVKRRRAHSFVTNFIKFIGMITIGFDPNYIQALGGNNNYVSLVDNTGATVYDRNRPTWTTTLPSIENQTANQTSYGIIIGTDNTSEAIDDYSLGALIAHGTGTGQMQYGTGTLTDVVTDANSSSFVITRDFSNDSGGSIVIREIGVTYYDTIVDNKHILLVRDVLSSAETVNDGEDLTVNYTIQINV